MTTFHVRTDHLFPEKTEEDWLCLFPDAVFDKKYAYFKMEAKDALKAITFLRDETGAKWSGISIWSVDCDREPPWDLPYAEANHQRENHREAC